MGGRRRRNLIGTGAAVPSYYRQSDAPAPQQSIEGNGPSSIMTTTPQHAWTRSAR
jgi:hypothetical protein